MLCCVARGAGLRIFKASNDARHVLQSNSGLHTMMEAFLIPQRSHFLEAQSSADESPETVVVGCCLGSQACQSVAEAPGMP